MTLGHLYGSRDIIQYLFKLVLLKIRIEIKYRLERDKESILERKKLVQRKTNL